MSSPASPDLTPALPWPAEVHPVAGLSLTRTALLFATAPSEHDLAQVAQALGRMDEALAWWWGDYLLLLRDRLGQSALETVARRTGRDPGTLARYERVAAYFAPGERRAGLSWNHHYEAMVAAAQRQGPRTAQRLLTVAERQGLSVAQLRAHIRCQGALRTATATGPARPRRTLAEVVHFNRWARQEQRQLDTYTNAEAAALMERLRDAHTFLEELAERAEVAASQLAPREGRRAS